MGDRRGPLTDRQKTGGEAGSSDLRTLHQASNLEYEVRDEEGISLFPIRRERSRRDCRSRTHARGSGVVETARNLRLRILTGPASVAAVDASQK